MTNCADEQLLAALEAILIVASEPLSPEELAPRLKSPPQQVKAALEQLRAEYAGETSRPHGFVLRNVAGGWRIYSCLLYTSPSPRDVEESRMPSSA